MQDVHEAAGRQDLLGSRVQQQGRQSTLKGVESSSVLGLDRLDSELPQDGPDGIGMSRQGTGKAKSRLDAHLSVALQAGGADHWPVRVQGWTVFAVNVRTLLTPATVPLDHPMPTRKLAHLQSHSRPPARLPPRPASPACHNRTSPQSPAGSGSSQPTVASIFIACTVFMDPGAAVPSIMPGMSLRRMLELALHSRLFATRSTPLRSTTLEAHCSMLPPGAMDVHSWVCTLARLVLRPELSTNTAGRVGGWVGGRVGKGQVEAGGSGRASTATMLQQGMFRQQPPVLHQSCQTPRCNPSCFSQRLG